MKNFKDLGATPPLLDILSSKKINEPTPIQAQAIPPVLKGSDCIGIAQTGTGKTLAFILPMIYHLIADRKKQALIVAPTRELAIQIKEVCDWFKKSQKIYSTVIIGGASMKKQIQEIKRGVQVMIVTPGRMIDHLKQKTIKLNHTSFLVLDEADRMFDMGFAPQIKEILKHMLPKEKRQTMLFSATMPDAIAKLVSVYMRQPVRIEIAAPGTAAADVKQEIIILDNQHRKMALLELLDQTQGSVLVFMRTKHQAKKLTYWLRQQTYRVEELHGNLSLAKRKRAVAAIQSKKSRILIATDVAARGIDITHLKLVVNFDLPENPDDYIHRIGRTGRAGEEGRAVSFVLSSQKNELSQIQKLLNATIKQTHLKTVPSATLNTPNKLKSRRKPRAKAYRRHGYRSGGGRRRR